jgi:hypothetical protein
MLPILLHMYGLPRQSLQMYHFIPTIRLYFAMPCTSTLRSTLPHDVLRLILEYAALNNRKTAVRLALVSRLAQHW